MAVKSADLESQLIDTVCERIRTRLPDEQATACETFTRQYYHWVPPEDLADRSPLDLYGAAVAHWNLAQRRRAGQAKVHVYNPEFEHHGWQSPHTVVEIVSDDMPFIVDSVTMELGRQGYAIDLVIHPVVRTRRDEDGNLLGVLEPGAPPGGFGRRVDPPRRGRARARRGSTHRPCATTCGVSSRRFAWPWPTGSRCARGRSSWPRS